ncbi:22892_t:CDS:1, partial [Gigaspora rosea]
FPKAVEPLLDQLRQGNIKEMSRKCLWCRRKYRYDTFYEYYLNFIMKKNKLTPFIYFNQACAFADFATQTAYHAAISEGAV